MEILNKQLERMYQLFDHKVGVVLSEQETPESFRKRMRNTVNDQSASYPQAEKDKNMNMWFDMWARDFILDFSKNEISKYVPSGSYGYCRKGHIHTYDYNFTKQQTGKDREFQSKNSLYRQLLDIQNLNKDNSKPKLYICDSQLEMMKYKWDHKFNVDGEQLGWWQLLNLDWGTYDSKSLQSAWSSAVNFIRSNKGEFCTENEQGVHCKSAVYEDPLSWFKDVNNLLTFFEVVTAFVPLVGPFLSAGFGLGNALVYWNNGDKKSAGISAFFALLPGLGSIGAKIVVKVGAKELEVLSEKLIKDGLKSADDVTKEFIEKNASKYTKEEIEVLENVAKNKESLKNEISKIPINNSNKLSEFISKVKNNTKANIVDAGINVTGIPAGLAAYPLFKKLNPGVRENLEKMGYNFESIKSSFGSSGSEKDNLLMLAALNDGWTPDQPVPEKYQTDNYKFIDNLISIEFADLPDSEEWNKQMDSWEKELGMK